MAARRGPLCPAPRDRSRSKGGEKPGGRYPPCPPPGVLLPIGGSMRKRSLLTSLAVVTMAAASTVAVSVAASPAHAATCNGYVGITFDDGPSNDHTPALLNALKQNGIRATVFNEGQYAAAYP